MPTTVQRIRRLLGILAAALLVLATPAAAYLDPGTGAILLQWLAAAFFGALVAIKLFWRRITHRMSTLLRGRREPETSEGDAQDRHDL